MQISDLVAIGKLGNHKDENGFLSFKEAEEFELFFLNRIFLLFTDNRVRYVEVIELDTSNGIKLKIDDDEIAAEAALDGKVQVMLPQKDISEMRQENGLIDLVGLPVKHSGKEIGKISDSFFNGAHEVIVMQDHSGKEILLPLVEKYLIRIEPEAVMMQNIEEFLKL